MTREELLHELRKESGLSRSEALKFYESLLDIALERIKEDGQFAFPGFGMLRVTDRKEREGRNPRTGEKLIIPPKKSMKFKPYKNLNAVLDSGEL